MIAGNNSNVCNDIELKIDPDPFCTPCLIFSMNKNSMSKTPLKPKAALNFVLWMLFQQQHQFFLTSDTTVSSYLLIVDA